MQIEITCFPFSPVHTHSQEVSEEVLTARKACWKIPQERQKVKGLLAKYRRSVSSAHTGAVTS